MWTVECRDKHRAQDAVWVTFSSGMQKILLSSAENQTCYQVDEFGSKRVEDWRLRRRMEKAIRVGVLGRGPGLGPCCQATAHENAAAFEVFSSSIRLDHLSAESFVGFHGSLRNR